MNVDNPENAPTVLSLCTGYGGIELGLEKAIGQITPVAHVEIEAFADTNLVNKMETGQMVPVPIWTDLKTFHAYAFRGKVDILTGGYPCQPFSAAGRRKGKEDPRHLWPWIKDIIEAVQPKFCFFENVEGHVTLGLREVLTDLVKLGYRVENDSGQPTWGIFSAAEVGAPHKRARVFILAYSINQREPQPEGDIKECRERSINGGEKLGNSTSNNKRRSPVTAMHREGIKAGRPGVGLADTRSKRLQGSKRARAQEERQAAHGPTSERCTLWPARPGKEQYEWEEPRTLENPRSIGRRGWNKNTKKHSRRPGAETETKGSCESQHKCEQQRETQPKLGRTVDGNTDRVDRLRLLGNGVCPDQAAKAFGVLMERIVNPDESYVPPSVQLEMFE